MGQRMEARSPSLNSFPRHTEEDDASPGPKVRAWGFKKGSESKTEGRVWGGGIPGFNWGPRSEPVGLFHIFR